MWNFLPGFNDTSIWDQILLPLSGLRMKQRIAVITWFSLTTASIQPAALCNIYIQYACIQFNFKRTIKTLCFETHFDFAFYIDCYKMALHFNRVIVYKGVDRTQNDLFLGKLYSIEFSKAAKNYALWNFF